MQGRETNLGDFEVPSEAFEETFRPEKPLPDAATLALELGELSFAEPLVNSRTRSPISSTAASSTRRRSPAN